MRPQSIVMVLAAGMICATGLAVAQTGTGNLQLACSTNVTVTPNLRGEGYTELTGDITLTCTGGVAPSVGTMIPQVNITVFYNTQVTSRLLPNANASNFVSEALLLVDEPGSGLPAAVPGFGPGAGQNLCPTPLTGCAEYVSQAFGSTIPVATDTPQGTAAFTPGKNVFQGIVNANSVTFFGIPVLAPGVTASRVFRITNVRVNANPLFGGSASGASPVQASVSPNGAISLTISNSTPYVGFVTGSLTASVSGASIQNQCTSLTKASITTLNFTENFGTAFKTRVVAQNDLPFAGQNGTPGTGGYAAQNVPGGIYNSESSFVMPVSVNQVAGLADYGTRLKATFNNIPTGVRVFVSTANVLNNNLPVPFPAVIGGSTGNFATGGIALMVSPEVTPDGSGDWFPFVHSTDMGPNNGNVPIAEIPVVNGSAMAVWEVVNTNPNTIETLKFAVYITYTANPAQNVPPPGTSTVNLSYAPTPPAFTASAAANASGTLTVPRFTPDAYAAKTFLIITAGACPSLSIAKAHSGNFSLGQANATYAVTVSNAATAGPTSGAVTVTETVPPGMALVSMAGPGWTCAGAACTRGDALPGGSNFPAITVTVNVAANAGTPLLNTVSVSGGGSANSAYSDSTNITAAPAAIAVTQGSGQSAPVNTAFSTALQAIVTDAGGNPVPGATVTFTAPSSGAGGSFAIGPGVSGTTGTAATNAAGVATAPAFTANTITGGYIVTASAGGVGGVATFTLTNSPALCSATVDQPTIAAPATPGIVIFNVIAAASCPWTLQSNVPWLNILLNSNGTSTANITLSGNRALALDIRRNTSSLPQLGTLTINGAVVTVNQAGSTDTTNLRYINVSFNNFLAREPGDAGVNFFLPLLNSAQLTKTQMAFNFFAAPEFNAIERFVIGLYYGILGRDPDFYGWDFHRRNLHLGIVTQDTLVTQFLATAEYASRYGSPTNDGFVTLLFQNALGRTPSAGDVAAWSVLLGNGTLTRTQVAQAFLNSPEFQTGAQARQTVFLLHATMLSRDPGTAGYAAWLGYFTSAGSSLTAAVNAFVLSPEFQGKLGPN